MFQPDRPGDSVQSGGEKCGLRWSDQSARRDVLLASGPANQQLPRHCRQPSGWARAREPGPAGLGEGGQVWQWVELLGFLVILRPACWQLPNKPGALQRYYSIPKIRNIYYRKWNCAVTVPIPTFMCAIYIENGTEAAQFLFWVYINRNFFAAWGLLLDILLWCYAILFVIAYFPGML